MSEQGVKNYTQFVLPSSVVSRVDLSHLVNEVDRVDAEMTSNAVRKKVGSQTTDTPVLSEELNSFLEANQVSLDDSRTRSELLKQLKQLKDTAPTLHMTFAVSADGESLRQIAAWLRESVHPQAVIDVGLQPGLVAGVYIRTPNHVHDFSVRGALAARHDVLIKELEDLRGAK